MHGDQITLRRSTTSDAATLLTLAVLDSQRLPLDQFLIGEVGGEPLAALGLATGILIANPYRATAEIAELLRVRAGSISSTHRPRHGILRRRAARPLPCD
jgi:hypothetical protein